MNKLFKYLTFAIAIFPLLASCNKGESQSEEQKEKQTDVSFELNSNKLNLEVYDSYLLTYTLTGTTSAVSWSSSNNEVATVKDGLIDALQVGNAVITASVAGLTATCDVNISSPSEAPVLHLSINEVKLEKNKTAYVDLNVTYKGKVIEAEYGFDFVKTYPNSLVGAEFVSLRHKNGQLEINSLSKYGNAEILIHTEVKGILLAKTIEIGVINTHNSLLFTNISKNANDDYELKIKKGTTFTPEVKLNEDDVDTLTTEFLYFVSDDTIISIDSGTINANKLGKTILKVFNLNYSIYEKVIVEVTLF